MRPEAYVSVETPLRFRGLERVELLGAEVPVATTTRSRLLGLALLSRRRAGAGLLIPRCHNVHTLGMRFRLEVIFLDGEQRVVDLRRGVPPGRVLRCPGAVSVLELPSPRLTGGDCGVRRA
jgi:uncharacterized membrane protein (UPF0127 family)